MYPDREKGSGRAIPVFLNDENRFHAGVFLFGSAIGLYLAANHFHFVPPQLLSFTTLDSWIPFIPQSVWIYVSEYLLFAWVYLSTKDYGHLSRYFFSFFTLQLVSVLIFWVYPTTYPRELFPLPEDLDKMTHLLFESLRSTDSPASCCPSLHVSATLLTALLYRDDQKGEHPLKVLGVALWAALICASTLTTKQHYVMDVFAGLFLAVVVFWVFHRILPTRLVFRKTENAPFTVDGI